MKSWIRTLKEGRLHTKLLLTYVMLLTGTIIILGISDFRLNRSTVLDMAQKDVFTIVRKNNEIIDAKFSRIREMIYGFMEDDDFYQTFSTLDKNNKTKVLAADIRIKGILDKYFAQSQDLYSVQVATSYFIFGTSSSANSEHAKNFIPIKGFRNTELDRTAKEADGKIQWVPTYNFADMYQISYLKSMEYDYKYLFSAVSLIRGSYYKGKFRAYTDLLDKPTLLLNFKDSLFTDVFKDSIPVRGSSYMVVDANGQIIAHTDRSLLTTKAGFPFLQELMNDKSGVRIVRIGGEQQVLAFARSNITGWLSIAVIPPSELLAPITKQYVRNMLISVAIITVVFIAFSYFLSMLVTNPFRTMIRAIVNTGEGRFETRFEQSGSYEFRILMKKFNDMNENIVKLIQENYETQIREKEAQIKALNLQLDPHFMYNTLNMVSLMALEKEEYEISDIVVSLSNMLKYMVKQESNLVRFRDDLTYLESYVTIMSNRFEGAFEVIYDIDQQMLGDDVPKFFLQPLVENAFVHGFKKMNREGKLRISCRSSREARIYLIEDNGEGMDMAKLASLREGSNRVGISNVNRRIHILYGEPYGLQITSVPGQGTTVTVTLPPVQQGEGLTCGKKD
ncbi:sensor histidine kinase [Paenibacillus sambharensis]|uniref:Sensor histidine kinase n=1 Tax=Paenibacillus sambharensis TaxID=1803190 RepID=A0A2W1LQI0_9BACL|nr:histidine kinase [Paenibacillus sambharensis]PZD97202.1 sensor histidine kinase [Paenibacillus sambharensis]